eukprot:UC1_evm1s1539
MSVSGVATGTESSPEVSNRIKVVRSPDPLTNGRVAASYGAVQILHAIAKHGSANIILATGASQFEMLHALAATPGIDWSRVTCFHLDQYVDMTDDHPASFPRVLKEHFVERLGPGVKLRAFHFVDGAAPHGAVAECARLGELLRNLPATASSGGQEEDEGGVTGGSGAIDVAFIGIGENGHLAFNDPPCDLETTEPYLVVQLDEACRRQQLGEGWFASMDEVPKAAITMSMHWILRSRSIVCTVPDERKSHAVKETLRNDAGIRAEVPASAMRGHDHAVLFIDEAAASAL